MDNMSICCMEQKIVHTKYGQLVHILYEKNRPYNIWTGCLYVVRASCLYMSYRQIYVRRYGTSSYLSIDMTYLLKYT